MKNLAEIIWFITRWAIVFYSIYALIFFFIQRQVIYPGQQIIPPPTIITTFPSLEIWSIPLDNGFVEAWFMPAPTASAEQPKPVLIYTHGNGEIIDYWPDTLIRFNEIGISVLLVEYPGYGRSDGKPSQKNIETVMLGAYDQLIKRPEVNNQQIIAYGHSLGGGAACLLAAKRPTAALILHSTFASLRSFAAQYGIPSFLIRDPFDSQAILKTYTNPILLIHGTEDKLIPFSHAQKLNQAAPHATLQTYPCGHNGCPSDWEEVWQVVTEFLTKHQLSVKH